MQQGKYKSSVTVVIPAYSRAEVLLETLKSVFDQKGDFQITVVVIDDHSPEPLKTIIAKHFPKVTVRRNSKNLKSGPSRNQAYDLVETDYVAFLDADDVWEPNFLKESIKALSSSSAVGTLAFSIPLISRETDLSFRVKINLLLFIRSMFLRIFCTFNNNNLPISAFYLVQISHMIFKWNKVKNIRFDKKYNYGGEDWKYALDVLSTGKIKIIPKGLVHYRYHPTSSTFKKDNLKNKWRSYNQLFPELEERCIKGFMVVLFSGYIKLFSRK